MLKFLPMDASRHSRATRAMVDKRSQLRTRLWFPDLSSSSDSQPKRKLVRVFCKRRHISESHQANEEASEPSWLHRPEAHSGGSLVITGRMMSAIPLRPHPWYTFQHDHTDPQFHA